MLHLSLALTAFVAVAPLANAASDATISADIPANYAAVVPQEAVAVAWVPNPQKVTQDLLSMGVPREGAPKTLNEMFDDTFKTSINLPLNTPLLFWADQLPKPDGKNEDFAPSFTFKAAGANAKNTTATGGNQVFFSGDMVIVRGSGSGSWKKPASTKTQLLSALPKTEVALAFDGKKMNTELEMAMRQLGSFGMLMVQARMKQRENEASPADKAVIAKTQQQSLSGMKRLLDSALDVMKDVDVLTMGMSIKDEQLDLDIDLHYPTNVQGKHGMNLALVDAVPGGMTGYLAMDAPATRFFGAMEHDVMEILLGLNAEQIKMFNLMGKQAAKITSMVTGGVVVGFGIKDRYEWTTAEVSSPETVLSGIDKILAEMNQLKIGVTAKSTNNETWNIDVDGEKIAQMLGGTQFTQKEHAARMGGNFVLSYSTSGNTITSKRHPVGKPISPNSNDTTIRNMLKPSKGALIFGMSIDLGELFYEGAQEVIADMKQVHHHEEHEGPGHSEHHTMTIPKPKGTIPFRILLTNPDEKTIELDIDIAVMKAVAYGMELVFAARD